MSSKRSVRRTRKSIGAGPRPQHLTDALNLTHTQRVRNTAALLAAGRGEALSENHYAEATELLKPLSESGAVTTAPTRVVNEVSRPKITLIEFADAIQCNINAQRFQTYALPDGMAVRNLLTEIAERTGAIDVATVNLDHLDS